MIKSFSFKISFLSTLIFLSAIFLFLTIDFNTKEKTFKNSPSILQINNINSNYWNVEIMGNKYELSPYSPNINKKYIPIIHSVIPQKLKLLESLFCYTYSTYQDIINYQKNLDYINNTK